MANYECTIRTNYFHVTDEKAYEELMRWISAEDFFDISKTESDGKVLHGFGSYGSMSFYPSAMENDEVKAHISSGHIIYDENGKEVPLDKINEYDVLYDGCGDQIFDRYCQDDNFDYFITKIREILPEDEVFVYMEAGHEKLRCVDGFVLVASVKEVKGISFAEFIEKSTEEMIGRCTSYVY